MRKRTIKEIESLLPKIRQTLEKLYADRLVDVILYGSFARGSPDENSDVDIAVVLKGEVNKAKEIDRIGDAIYDLMLETGELISVYPLSEIELRNTVWPLYYHIKKEGIKL